MINIPVTHEGGGSYEWKLVGAGEYLHTDQIVKGTTHGLYKNAYQDNMSVQYIPPIYPTFT